MKTDTLTMRNGGGCIGLREKTVVALKFERRPGRAEDNGIKGSVKGGI